MASPTWVPASEIRGEGIFFQFSETEIQDWLGRDQRLDLEFFSAHKQWRKNRGLDPPEDFYPGPAVRAAALVRPRPDPPAVAGVRLHGGIAPGADLLPESRHGSPRDGGRPDLHRGPRQRGHARRAGLAGGAGHPGAASGSGAGLRCGSVPATRSAAEHHPGKEGTSLHGASCHACLFAPETSCERGNKYLDRTVLVPTVDRDEFAFFHDLESDASVSCWVLIGPAMNPSLMIIEAALKLAAKLPGDVIEQVAQIISAHDVVGCPIPTRRFRPPRPLPEPLPRLLPGLAYEAPGVSSAEVAIALRTAACSQTVTRGGPVGRDRLDGTTQRRASPSGTPSKPSSKS